MANSSSLEQDTDVNIMMASDDSYVAPLCVTALSLLRKLRKDRKINLYIIDFEISKDNKTKLNQSLYEYIASGTIKIHYVPIFSNNYTGPTYGRLIGMLNFMQSTGTPNQYIYLDADMVVRHDISKLWDECRKQIELLTAGNGIFAVQDFGYPNGHENLGIARKLFETKGFEVVKNQLYYNAGVFYIDLNAIEQKVKNQLGEHMDELIQIAEETDDDQKKKVLFADQDILNLFFRIDPLDKRWNVQGIGSYMKDRCKYENAFFPKLFTVEEYTKLVKDPFIVHFTGSDKASIYYNFPSKPWNPMCQNPFKDEFLKYKAETSFKHDTISNDNDMTNEIAHNKGILRFMQSLNRTAKNNPKAVTINFHFVRHGERQGFYPQGETSWCSENILNKDRLHDDALTGFGKTMAHVAGKRILETLEDKENRSVLVFTSPFIRCVETAFAIYDVLSDRNVNTNVKEIYVDKGFCEYLKEDWFGGTMKEMGTSRFEDIFYDIIQLETELKKATQKNLILREHTILPVGYQLEFESDDINDMNQDRFRLMASRILENGHENYGVDVGQNKVTDVVFVSHGGVLHHIVRNMFRITSTEAVVPDLGRISYASHCHLKYNYLLSELELISPFSTPTETTPGQNWNDAVSGEWKNIFKMVTREEGTDINILEIGSWEGLSATRFLSMIPDCKLWCVDHFDELGSEEGKERLRKFLYNVRATGKRHNVILIIGFSFPALLTLLKTGINFDISYIDGSHRSDDTYLDAEMAWRMSKNGSLMLFDDYKWPVKSQDFPMNPVSIDDIEHPKKGIDAFLKVHKDELEIVYKGYQVCVKKEKEVRLGFPIRGEATFIPLKSFLTHENMMNEDEETLVDYIFEHVQQQSHEPNNILVFDFSR